MIDAGFTPRLERGERLLWTGQPAQGLLLTAANGFLIPFSLVWCGFVLASLKVMIRQGGSGFSRRRRA